MTIQRYTVTGMTCSACSSGIERTVSALDGVKIAEVSLMAKSMKVEYDEAVLTEERIFSAVKGLGYGIYREGEQPQDKRMPQDKLLFVRFIISVCILAPLLYVSMGSMLGAPLPFFIDPDKGYAQWFALYQCVLSAAIIGVNYAFFKNGVKALFKRVPNMDTLVALGSGVSFAYSLVVTVFIFIGGNFLGMSAVHNAMHNLYFESAATILTLVTVGKWLEEKSKKRTGDEIEKLLKLAPDSVTVEDGEGQKVISVSQLKVGDIIIVKQGEYIPADGKIVYGSSFVDKCAITGESIPVEVTVGDAVTSAAIVKSGLIKIKAEKVGGETTLSKIINMVREAGASKAPIQKFADRVAGVFVPVVCALALITFVIWLLVDGGFNPEHCITYSISVLVVSCPCALGLATPVAIMTATGKGASLGVLYKDAESLQKVCAVNAVLLDKTATLTEGKPKVTDAETFGISLDEAKFIACGIECNSNHPLAKCIVEYVGDGAAVENFEYIVGKGAQAEYGGKKYLLGNLKLLEKVNVKPALQRAEELSAQGKTVIYLADDKKVLALFAVADTVKGESAQAVRLLKDRGLRIAMLTGDGEKTAAAVAASVGIDEYVAEVLPEDKLSAVKNVQAVGGCVAMVGDGINDSPALKQSDVGIAIGSGTDVAIDSAGVVLVSEDLRTLDTVFDLSRAAVRNIKQNLFWAFFYNVVMIPVAAGAFSALGFAFNPMWAALCMSLSSLFVVCNALRLLRYKNKKFVQGEEYMKTIVHIEGMCCEHCAKRVGDKLGLVANAVSVDVKHKKNIAVIRSREPLDGGEITKLVEEAGYKVTSIETK